VELDSAAVLVQAAAGGAGGPSGVHDADIDQSNKTSTIFETLGHESGPHEAVLMPPYPDLGRLLSLRVDCQSHMGALDARARQIQSR
jgi:hypothetical protein